MQQIKRIKAILESKPFFLLLLPLYVLIRLENIFYGLVSYRFVGNQVLFMILASILMHLISRRITGEKKKSALIAFILMLSWLYAGLLKNYLHEHHRGLFPESYTYFLPTLLVMILVAIAAVLKSRKHFNRTFLFINSLWFIFILIEGISILSKSIQTAIPKEQFYTVTTPRFNIPDTLKPDIYYIIFDSYSSGTILQKMGFDNHRIEEKLSASGYKMITKGTSNYNLTPFSIGSTLNMQYLEEADTGKKYYLDNYLPAINIVKQNTMFPWLQQNGYRIINHTFFDFPGNHSGIRTHDIWDMGDTYAQHNLGLKVYKDLAWKIGIRPWITIKKMQHDVDLRDAYDDTVYQRLLNSHIDNDASPKFVYAHFFMPHIPTSHDSAGRKIPINNHLTPDEEKKGYWEEILYVNKRIGNISDALIQHSKKPLVIIIQGDHGYRFYDDTKKQDEFPNFFAVYFSSKDYRQVPDTLSNVNLFRAVMNTYFNQQIPFETNKHFFLQYK